MNSIRICVAVAALATLTACSTMDSAPGKRELMIVGNDNKVTWDASGKVVLVAPGTDSVMVLDMAEAASRGLLDHVRDHLSRVST